MCRTRLRLIAIALILLLGGAVAGCASTVRVGSPQHSCSPGFFPSNEFGSISAQQRGPGEGIQWGVYPAVPAVRYVVDVYLNNKVVDHKDQPYPPHASLPSAAARKNTSVHSGDIFRLDGKAYDGRGDVGIFYLTCKAA